MKLGWIVYGSWMNGASMEAVLDYIFSCSLVVTLQLFSFASNIQYS
jgi:hypothetical protein